MCHQLQKRCNDSVWLNPVDEVFDGDVTFADTGQCNFHAVREATTSCGELTEKLRRNTNK